MSSESHRQNVVVVVATNLGALFFFNKTTTFRKATGKWHVTTAALNELVFTTPPD